MENIKLSKVTRLGNGLAIVIPRAVLQSMNIKRGDHVVVAVYDKNIFAVRKIPQQELRDLKPGDLKF
jgi:antitoxin component of MazEF toxin-antitoxin module